MQTSPELSDVEEGELPETSSGPLLGVKRARAPYFYEDNAHADMSPRRDDSPEPVQRKPKKLKKTAGFVDIYGEGACAAVELRHETGPITLDDVRQLVLWILGEETNPRWCFVKNKPLVRQVVLMLVHGLDSEKAPPDLADVLGPPIDLRARKPTMEPGHSAFSLLTHPPPGAQPHKFRRRASDPSQANASLPPPESYKLSLDQLEEHGYPLPVLDEGRGEMEVPEGYVATRGRPAIASPLAAFARPTHHRMVALDCEMCVTSAGLELTRLVLLDEWGDALLDELVAPRNPITDYVTRYSGITPKMMEGVTTRLEDVQTRFCEIVHADTLLIAHSGENDLHALKVVHASVIDTSVLYPHARENAKTALRVLAHKFLRRAIQQETHDPLEDARAALDLALLKFKRGPTFGLPPPPDQRRVKLADTLSDSGCACTFVDCGASLRQFIGTRGSAVDAESDNEVCRKLAKEVGKIGSAVASSVGNQSGDLATVQSSPSRFLFGQLRDVHLVQASEVAASRKATDEHKKTANVLCDLVRHREPSPAAQAAEKDLVKRVQAVYNAAPPGTLMTVVCGQGNTALCGALSAERAARQAARDDCEHPWTVEHEDLLAALCARVGRGLCWVRVKGSSGGTAVERGDDDGADLNS